MVFDVDVSRWITSMNAFDSVPGPLQLAQASDGAVSEEAGSFSAREWIHLDDLAVVAERFAGMVGGSALSQRLFSNAARLAPYKATVLIQGESGTGKELIARALHTLGPTPKGPFVTFNCSNLLDTLAESQLFGHVRGAFTDARQDSLGYFRSADGGTLFLDEIGELPLRLQAKLLRIVETREVQPVGSSQSYHVDIRLVAATNRDLKAMIRAAEFRDDLYYRLNTTTITIPPLRDRRDDIEALAAHFIDHYSRMHDKSVKYLSCSALESLKRHDWPGNVREFANAIESALLLCESDRIGIGDLAPQLAAAAGCAGRPNSTAVRPDLPAGGVAQVELPAPEPGLRRPTGFSLDEVMKDTLVRSLRETDGNRRRAAGLLGISRSTLYRMLTRYGLASASARNAGRLTIPSDGHGL
jgi:DNA-binding NtrC family response regulator